MCKQLFALFATFSGKQGRLILSLDIFLGGGRLGNFTEGLILSFNVQNIVNFVTDVSVEFSVLIAIK